MARLLILPLALLGLLVSASSAQAQLTTLYSNIEGPRTVTGIDAHPVGPTDQGVFRTARRFTPTTSGQAELLSIRGRCVGIVCAEIGKVTLHEDAGGRPAEPTLGTMGFYLLEGSEGSWEVRMKGNPTGGSFRLKVTADGKEQTTAPLPYDIWHRDNRGCNELPTLEEILECLRNPPPDRDNIRDRIAYWPIPVGVLSNGRFPADPAYFRVNGTVEVTDVQLTGGTNPSISVTQPTIEEECGTLSPAPQLVAGKTYWAVMSANDEVGWDDWTDDRGEVLESVDGGRWWPAFSDKMPALRIDTGSSTCDPVAEPNPASGTSLGQMIVHPGGKKWTSISMSNSGVAPLTIGSATFANQGQAFTLMDGEPGPLARPARLKPVGIGGTSLFYPTCNGDVPEDWYRSTLVLETSDPTKREIRYPISCLVDGTPPRFDFDGLGPNGQNGWFTRPADGLVEADDPESENMVDRISCSRAGETTGDQPGRITRVNLTAEGDIALDCTATDIAGNTGAAQHAIKIDTRPPARSTDVTPELNADGWSNAPQVTVRFECRDPGPGSGVAPGFSPGGTVTEETEGKEFDSGECADVAGHAVGRDVVRVRIDRSKPAIDARVVPTPNAAGWHRTDPTVVFDCIEQGTVRSGIKTDTVEDQVVGAETPGRTITSGPRCADGAGNEAAAVSRTVKLDKTEPWTRLDGGPSGATRATTADFEVRGADGLSGVARLECRLDGAAFSTCTSPAHRTGLADGNHTLSVRGVDVAGNFDNTPATRTWTVDTVAPETSVDSGPPAVTASRSASLTYGADALGGSAVADWECRLDDAAFAPCAANGKAYSHLAGGRHRFEVRARDAAGNADATPAVHTWRIDLDAPSTRIVETPDAYSAEAAATFAFQASDTGGSDVAEVECRLDDGHFAPCTSPVSFSDLATGPHRFEVRATDGAGNVEGPPAAYAWEIGTVFAIADDASTREDGPVTIDVRDNDVSFATGPVAVAPVRATSANGGRVTAAGDEALRYTPPADFNGTDRFDYTLSADGEASSGTATVRVEAVNDAPAFTAGAPVAVDEDSGAHSAAWATGMTAGPTDESGQQLRFAVEDVSDRALFSVQPAVSATGELTFTPAPDASGSAAVRIRLIDDGSGHDASSPVTVQLTVRPVDDAPTIAVVGARRCDGGSATLRIRVHDVDSATLTHAASASSRRVRVALAGAGPVRTLRLTRLSSGLRTSAKVRVSDGSRSSSIRLRIAVGTRRGETLAGRRGPDLLLGLGGRDRIGGRGGDDVLCGGAGRDTLTGGPGADLLRGGPGGDLFADLGPGDRALDLSRRRGDRRGRS
jgi:Ca2+-binding RTX toxin-like protein